MNGGATREAELDFLRSEVDKWRNIADDLADVLTDNHFTDDIIPGECRSCDALARYREQAGG